MDVLDDFKARIKRICLICNHNGSTCETKKEHKDIVPCPKCNGSFVDVWVQGKYKKQQMKCEHNYSVLVEDIDVIKCMTDNQTKYIRIEGAALFYCTKCLDVEEVIIP